MPVTSAVSFVASVSRSTRAAVVAYAAARTYAAALVGVAVTVFYRGSRQDVYNILWAVVFGFATLNIISLAARRLEPTRRGLSFGELMAVMVVLLSIFLLGWEMLNLFHIFPIRLRH
ncbi:MAG TPA: hypothetical protein VGM18_09180 [Candidatus Sulfotelmatobacter sp.]|jgi:hypothetical protein